MKIIRQFQVITNDQKTIASSFKISIILFLCLFITMALITVSNTKQTIFNKLDIDKNLISQSIYIGDFFFLKKYLSSLHDLSTVKSILLFDVATSTQSIVIPRSSIIRRTYSFGTEGVIAPISINVNESWRINGNLIIRYEQFTMPFLLSLFTSLLIFVLMWKQMEAQLRRKSLEVKNKLAQQVAHDVRSPLGALKTATKAINTHPLKASALMEKAIHRIDEIIEDLKPNTNHQTAFKKIDLCSLIRDLTKEKELEYKNSSQLIRIITHYSSKNIFINGDKSSLSRAVSNIINNSLEAANKHIAEVNIEVKEERDSVTLEISDNGKGIRPEKINEICKFGYSDGKINGNGLGLSQVSETVNKHGGKLKISSELGKGTRVLINFHT